MRSVRGSGSQAAAAASFSSAGRGGSSEILQRLGGLRVSLNGRTVDPDSVDWSRADIRRYQFIQGAGGKNVLGVVKFRFPNKHDVYMHDTPDRHLFGNAPRAFSHGCMRTQNPVHLAEVLLAHDKGYSAAQVRSMAEFGSDDRDQADTSMIPVHIAYFTAEVDEKGQVRYFPDLYGLDGRVASALKGQPVHFSSQPAISAAEEGPEATRRVRARAVRAGLMPSGGPGIRSKTGIDGQRRRRETSGPLTAVII